MIAIVAPETAWKISMSEVVGIGAPSNFHLRKNIPLIDRSYFLDVSLDQRRVLCIDPRVLRSIKVLKRSANFPRCGRAVGVIAPQRCHGLLVAKRQVRIDAALR